MGKTSADACVWVMVLCTMWAVPAHTHIRLTFPPARPLALDFLDNVRTPSPCGMPYQGSSNITTLSDGSTFNVTWHLGYAHLGGIRLELLTGDRVTHNLTSAISPTFVATDMNTEVYQITLPAGYTCTNCTLRLLRQTLEWGSDYTFWSCADIAIIPRTLFVETCSGHGQFRNGQCLCDRLYHGNKCQYADECGDDSDCGGNSHGVCMASTTLSPVAQSPARVCYCQPGWFGRNCSKASAITSVNADLSTYVSRRLSADVSLYYKIIQDVDEIEMVIQAKTDSWVALGWRPANVSPQCRDFPLPGTLLPVGSVTKSSSTSGQPQPEPAAGTTYDEFHSMDCTDIVIGSARGALGRVGDFYTRDRSTPRPDHFYGGTDSLTAAHASEINGLTTVIFRRPRSSSEQTDYSLKNTAMQVNWAYGQARVGDAYQPDDLRYHGSSNRGFASIDFTDATEVEESSFLPSSGECHQQQWSSPANCQPASCDYRASWVLVGSEVSFTISAKQDQTRWTGIGFASLPRMANADVIIGWQSSLGGIVADGWIGAQYSSPVLDKQQNVQQATTKYENGVITLQFTRSLTSPDTSEDLSLATCLYVFYPVGGGVYHNASAASPLNIGEHTTTPVISTDKMCFNACRGSSSKIAASAAHAWKASLSVSFVVGFIVQVDTVLPRFLSQVKLSAGSIG